MLSSEWLRVCPHEARALSLTFRPFHTQLKQHRVKLCRVEVNSDQMNLESFAEGCEWFRCPDIGHEFIPPLKLQNRGESWLRRAGFFCSQWWLYQPASWCSRAKCSGWDVWSDQCLEVDGCSSIDGLEGQHHRLELDAGRNRKPVEVMEEQGHRGEFR